MLKNSPANAGDAEARQAIVHWVAKSPTRLDDRKCTCARVHARTRVHTHTHTDNQKQSIFRKWSTYSRPNKLDLNSRWEKPCCFQPWKQKFTGSETIFPPRTAVCAVRVFATLWTVARQAPLSMGFFRQDYWSGLPCPPPGDLPN